MVRKFAALFALILTFGLAAAPVAAQSVDDMSEFGLESGYTRIYLADPNAENANPELMGVMVAGFQFDEADTAADAFEDFTCGFAGGFLGAETAVDCEGLVDEGFEVADVDGIGEQAIEVRGEADVSGPTPTTMLALQSDNYLFVVIYLGVEEEGAADDFANFLADAETVDTEVMLSEDGSSTGGFFDMLPQEGDPEVEGLMPAGDDDLLGTVSGTPAS